MERTKQILVIIATAGMIFLNYLAAAGILGGIDTGAVSDKYPTNITPAGYAFAIWSLIYLGMIAFSIYQALPSNREKFKDFRLIYMISCVANGLWLYIWSQELIVVCLGIIVVLLSCLAAINGKLKRTETNAEYWLVKVPFGIYFGWVTAATILNTTIALVYLGVKTSATTAHILGAILIFTAAGFGVLIRFTLKNYFYPLAIAWALSAIAVKQSGQTVIVVSCAFAVIICLVAAISFVMEMNGKSYE